MKFVDRAGCGLGVITLLLGWAWWEMARMPGATHRGPAPAPTPEERLVEGRLRADVEELAGRIGVRSDVTWGNLERARGYLEARFAALGYQVRRQGFPLGSRTLHNLEVELPGAEPAAGVVVVGAHYDTVPQSPGADDNATGAAAVLAVAELLAGRRTRRGVRFVAFANEEPPAFQTPEMGSYVYARRCRERGERIAAMVAVDSIGRYSSAPGSSRPLPPFNLLLPDRAEQILFVGNFSSRRLVRRLVESFRRSTPFPSSGLAVPPVFPGIGWSDHWSFWQHGYPAVMVTVSPFPGDSRYHRPDDVPATIGYAEAARVVAGLARAVLELADAP